MGLFEKKFCCICNGKAGMLSRVKIKGGKYLCSDCSDLCSSEWIENGDMDEVDEEAVREHIDYMKMNNQVYDEYFDETDSVTGDYVMDDAIFTYDTENGWWMHNDEKMIYRFCDVKNYTYHIVTSRLERDEDDEEDRDDGGILGGILDVVSDVATALADSKILGRDDIQTCPRGNKIDEIYINVKVDSPWMERVRIDVVAEEIEDPSDMQQAYQDAARIMNLFDKYADFECSEISLDEEDESDEEDEDEE